MRELSPFQYPPHAFALVALDGCFVRVAGRTLDPIPLAHGAPEDAHTFGTASGLSVGLVDCSDVGTVLSALCAIGDGLGLFRGVHDDNSLAVGSCCAVVFSSLYKYKKTTSPNINRLSTAIIYR